MEVQVEPNNYYERYMAGEYEQVWHELIALGEKVREEPLYSSAIKVVEEIGRRAKQNCEHIIAKLLNSGYIFDADYEHIYAAPPPDALAQVRELEDRVGYIPLIAAAWYTLVGEVNLTGTHPQWRVSGYALSTYDKTIRPNTYAKYRLESSKTVVATEPLQVKGISEQFEWYEMWRKHYRRSPFSLFISPHQNDRSGFSGGEIDEIIIPSPAVDGLVIHDKGYEPAEYFVDYLRRSFAWGGFPGLATVKESLRPTKMLEYLKEGLLPL